MCTRTRIQHVYQGVQGACPRQAVTGAEGMAERQRVPCRRHGSKACAYVIAGGYVSAYVIASGCVNSLMKTSSVILLPSWKPSTTFLHHLKSKIH